MATTEHKLPARPDGPNVTAVLVRPDDAFALLVLGPGAGTPIHRPLMVHLADALAHHGVATFRYNYPYGERGQAYSVADIDPLDVLLTTAAAAKDFAHALIPDLPLFIGGRSMSAQVVSLALTREDWPEVRGAILYVFPNRWRHVLSDTVGHLSSISVPMLLVQGDRDEEAPIREIKALVEGLGDKASLHVIEGADHSYNIPADTGRTQMDAIAEAASATATWMHGLLDTQLGEAQS